MKYILPIILLLLAVSSHAQRRVANKAAGRQQKDSLGVLLCPINGGYQPTKPKQAYEYDKPPLNIILTSSTDTVVRASIDGVVSKVQRGDEGFEIVFYHNNYWFWYSGLEKAAVRANQKVKAGDPIGYIQPGQQIEVLIYDFETPIDPKKYLDCKK
jgi:hypothetical protein